ncbi:MAG: TnpV protein [Eubacteriales bacterium]|nr:TnpV protein [Eubacteriales bacterium]
MEITYRQAGDYLLPELELRSEETRIIGKYGMLRRTYLKEYKSGWYQSMLLTGKLDKHLADVDEQATIRFEQIVKQMKKAEGVTEKLKNENQFVWIQKMNNIQARAMEIIGEELIFV